MIFTFLLCALQCFTLLFLLFYCFKQGKLRDFMLQLETRQQHIHDQLDKLVTRLLEAQQTQQTALSESRLQLQESLHKGLLDLRQHLIETLKQHAEVTGHHLDKLTQNTDQKLKEISGQVEKRLSDGFEKTTATFADVLKRLALIDEAQKKITELSTNVVSLQEILADKRSRGAFGEVQLNILIRNLMPEHTFALQHTLSNGKRADCILFLPPPSGNIVIDAKFPLETYRKLTEQTLSDLERRTLEQQFRQDIRRHVENIASKYIISGETAEGAVMFIPAEAIFAEIHAHYPEIVEEAQQKCVWLVSPTTMMAVLTTARAVLKDAATQKQVHLIQEHLTHLAKDFERFQKRMDNLAKHIDLAHTDVQEVKTSADKITSRFQKIEKVELPQMEMEVIPAEVDVG